MNYKLLSPFLLLLSVMLLFTFSKVNDASDEKVTSRKLDEIAAVPNWLEVVVDEALPHQDLNVWVPTGDFQFSSLTRIPRFPRRFTDEELTTNPALKKFEIVAIPDDHVLYLSGIQNEQISAQLAVAARNNLTNVQIKVSALKSKNGHTIAEQHIETRFVKYIPVHRSRSEYIWSAKYEDVAGNEVSGFMSPDVVGDPLITMQSVDVPAYRAQAVWFTFRIPKETISDNYVGTISLSCDEFPSKEYNIEIEVHNKVLPDPSDYEFFLDMWLNPNSIAVNHQVESWSEEHWTLLEKYMSDLASRGGKTITATITQEPWRKPWLNESLRPQTGTGFETLVKWKMTKKGVWDFDYSLFDRYVQTSMDMGLNERINAYSMTSFSGKEWLKYFDEQSSEYKEQSLDSVGSVGYTEAWSMFLQDFSRHLEEKGWLEKTYLCFDERPNETMQQIIDLVSKYAPHFKERIAISGHPESTKYASGFLSISYEFFPGQNLDKKETLEVINERNQEGKITTFYLCGQPDHPNTLTFSPAIESQMVPWLALKYNVSGYLRWAYCSWPKTPFDSPVHNYIQGDEYVVYPGKNGPISSVRWELMKEGIEEYELVRMLLEKGDIAQTEVDRITSLATQNPDGRFKQIDDLKLVRQLLFKANQTNRK